MTHDNNTFLCKIVQPSNLWQKVQKDE